MRHLIYMVFLSGIVSNSYAHDISFNNASSEDYSTTAGLIGDASISHADPEGMYHYHFAPLCLKDNKGD